MKPLLHKAIMAAAEFLEWNGIIAALLLLIILLVLQGCASLPSESDDVSAMWAFAYAHRQYDRPDSRDVRYVADATAECIKAGTPVYAALVADSRIEVAVKPAACTVLGEHNYSILSQHPSAMEIAHEASHRRYGDWHKGYAYFTPREWQWIGAK